MESTKRRRVLPLKNHPNLAEKSGHYRSLSSYAEWVLNVVSLSQKGSGNLTMCQESTIATLLS